jgi:hypothetical protein
MTSIGERLSVLRQLTRLWRGWRQRRTAVAELNCCGSEEQDHIARDVGLSTPALRVLAGKWPDSADLLTRRMEQLALDAADIARVEPQVIQDLQRVCSLCASKGRCARDMAENPSDPGWQDYCPNAMTLKALLAERSGTANSTSR